MFLVVGLGNPGRKYSRTRHNIGFRVVDEFQRENDFPKFKLQQKSNSLISEREITDKKVILAKPQTFMNDSGKAVKALIINYQLSITNLIVAHDDLDLPLGKIRISHGRGSAGHKGVGSIIKELGTNNFVRLRIGIMNEELGIRNAEDFVLEKFSKDEEKIISEAIKKTCQALKTALTEGLEKAMAEFN